MIKSELTETIDPNYKPMIDKMYEDAFEHPDEVAINEMIIRLTVQVR
ncbi:hypothetical protein ACDZ28_24490 [Paenibacillus sp. RS8]